MGSESKEEFIYDATNEGVILGAAAHDEKTRRTLVHRISPDSFLVPRHQLLWRVLRVAMDRGVDLTSEVATRLIQNEGGDASTIEYFGGIVAEAAAPQNLDWHVETLLWDSARARALQGPIPELLRQIKDPKASQADVTSSVGTLSRMLTRPGRKATLDPEVAFRQYRADLAARRVTKASYPLGEAGAFDLRLTEGFAPGLTWLSAGLSSAGKTTVWISFAIRIARYQKRRVLYCAWEMEPNRLIDIGCSHLTGIPLPKIVTGNLDEEEYERVTKAAAWINSRIRFMTNPGLRRREGDKGKPSNERNLDLVAAEILDSGCVVVIYDLFERILVNLLPNEVTMALNYVQEIHKSLGVCGVILNQINLKDVERRQDKRPTREAVKGVGTYVETADVIIGIHRDAQFKAVPDQYIETICLKQRMGASNWSVRWAWDGPTCRVSDPEEVPFDPGLEAVVEGGELGSPGDIKIKKRKR